MGLGGYIALGVLLVFVVLAAVAFARRPRGHSSQRRKAKRRKIWAAGTAGAVGAGSTDGSVGCGAGCSSGSCGGGGGCGGGCGGG